MGGATGAAERTRLGKYQLVRPLAEGGMARLYLAKTSGIGSFERHLVVKLILRDKAGDSNAVKMLLDEARLAATLNHQNVAQVYEVGEEDGLYYLAMEYVHGQDLRALVAHQAERGQPLPLPFALTIAAGVAAGLHHAHERRGPDGTPLQIVHRDVSPSNVMVAYDGAVKLVDFGLAKAAQRSAETRSGIVKGKIAYLSPEQARGQAADRRADVFALGIVLYEITTMRRAFRAKTDFETMQNIATGNVRRPRDVTPGYAPSLEAVVMKALAVDLDQRYQTAAEVLAGIEQVAAEQRIALSNVALGHFMRQTFGDVPEPWLVSSPGIAIPPGTGPGPGLGGAGRGAPAGAAAAPGPGQLSAAATAAMTVGGAPAPTAPTPAAPAPAPASTTPAPRAARMTGPQVQVAAAAPAPAVVALAPAPVARVDAAAPAVAPGAGTGGAGAPGAWVSPREYPRESALAVASSRTLPPDAEAMARITGRLGYAGSSPRPTTAPEPQAASAAAASRRRWWIVAIVVVAALAGGGLAVLQATGVL